MYPEASIVGAGWAQGPPKLYLIGPHKNLFTFFLVICKLFTYHNYENITKKSTRVARMTYHNLANVWHSEKFGSFSVKIYQ